MTDASSSLSARTSIYVNENVDELDLAQALAEISPARREYALRYRFERDRRLSVAVYLLLKEGLRKEFGIEENPVLASGPNGKPFLADHPEIHFSFSHCSSAAACALASSPVGIDVETIAPVDWAVAAEALSPDELREVRGAERPDIVFARYWTMKEALVKLRGETLGDRRLPDLLSEVKSERFETRIAARYVLSVAAAR